MDSCHPKIISLTTMCSAGCSHCPYSNPKLAKLYLKQSSIIKIVNLTSEKLIMLTGGEPLQHPEIAEILKHFLNSLTPFRLATGGFIDFKPWINQLEFLYKRHILQGISIGTDVISQRVSSAKWVKIWISNIQLLQNHRIPYSLTMTIDPELEFKWLNIWKCKIFKSAKPSFIFLRYLNKQTKNLWVEKIAKTFDSIPIIEDCFNYLLES